MAHRARRSLRALSSAFLMAGGALLSLPALTASAAPGDEFNLDVALSHLPANPEAGAAVDFTLQVTNPTSDTVTITALAGTLTNPAGAISPCDADGPGSANLLGDLGPGASTASCTFSIDAFAAGAGLARDLTVVVSASAVDGNSTDPDTTFVVVDENSIDNDMFYFDVADGVSRKWVASELSDPSPSSVQRSPIPFFVDNVGQQFIIRGGAGSAGFHTFDAGALPASWTSAGPTGDPVRNFYGSLVVEPGHLIPNGLGGNGNDSFLSNIQGDALESLADLQGLVGLPQLCVLVKDSDVSANDNSGANPNLLSFQGSYLGTAAFQVDEVLTGSAIPSDLVTGTPAVRITVLDADSVCGVTGSGTATDTVTSAAAPTTTEDTTPTTEDTTTSTTEDTTTSTTEDTTTSTTEDTTTSTTEGTTTSTTEGTTTSTTEGTTTSTTEDTTPTTEGTTPTTEGTTPTTEVTPTEATPTTPTTAGPATTPTTGATPTTPDPGNGTDGSNQARSGAGVEVEAQSLPRTGGDTPWLLTAAGLLMMVGSVLIAAPRRRLARIR